MKLFQLLFAAAAFLSLFTGVSQAESKRLIRFEHDGKKHFGMLESDDTVRVLKKAYYKSIEPTDQTLPLSKVKLLAPAVPKKVFGVAGNYRPATAEAKQPPNPELFFKSPTSVIAHKANVVIPPDLKKPLYEAELVVVIGKRAKNVSVEEAPKHVLGFTCGNDVSGGDWGKDVQWWRLKGTDTFAPCGPHIVTDLDPTKVDITLRLNGKVVQQGNSSQYHFNAWEVVSFISKYVTLEPGDLIYMGTPLPVDGFKEGDVMEVDIEGIGVLRNPAVRGKG